MEQLKKKYLFLIGLLTSSSSQKLLVFGLLGLILIGFGVLVYKTNIFSSGDKVEILNNTTVGNNAGPESPQDIVVEISGSVEKAGVYKMKTGDRIDDLLIAAGGLSINADRSWVTKNINRASRLTDGQKLYIYSQIEVESANTNSAIKLDQDVLGAENQSLGNLININTASLSKLIELPEIAQKRGESIIEHRPYSNPKELVSKGVISQKIFDKIKNEITTY